MPYCTNFSFIGYLHSIVFGVWVCACTNTYTRSQDRFHTTAEMIWDLQRWILFTFSLFSLQPICMATPWKYFWRVWLHKRSPLSATWIAWIWLCLFIPIGSIIYITNYLSEDKEIAPQEHESHTHIFKPKWAACFHCFGPKKALIWVAWTANNVTGLSSFQTECGLQCWVSRTTSRTFTEELRGCTACKSADWAWMEASDSNSQKSMKESFVKWEKSALPLFPGLNNWRNVIVISVFSGFRSFD